MILILRSLCCIVAASFLLFNCVGRKQFTPTGGQMALADPQGKELFTTHCVSCHAMEQEEIGPRLGGVTSLLSEKELIAFIKNPNHAIESGNVRAVSLSRRYKMIMPPFDFLKEEEMRSILGYIASETKLHNIEPLEVKPDTEASNARLGQPVIKTDLKIELEDFVTIPPSSDKMPRTRIANMRPGPSHDGTLYVSDQRGLIYQVSGKEVTTFLDLRSQVENFVNEPGLGTGLGSFAFHPEYLQNGLIYITHTESVKGKPADYFYNDSIKVALQWVVSEWKIDNVKSAVFKGRKRELLRINVPNVVHGTQDIGFNPEAVKGDKDYGLLYIGTGDGGSTISKHPELCHSLHSLLGTIIRIDPLGNNSKNGSYGIPADNPFFKETGHVYKEIYAYGFRNPHRLAWHNGKLFSAEVGESNFEEVNVIVKGGDYGWNVREGNFAISSKDLKNVYPVPEMADGKFEKPFLQYDHVDGNAISGGYVYEGAIEALKDKYLFGDIVNGRIFYANIDAKMSDQSIYELMISRGGKATNLIEMSGSKRVDIRIEYDRYTKQMYIMTKSDGKIRRITKAYTVNQP
ncbi:PQQ-dependent sugar dehydrogenase [Dyadobacter sp. CY261]|uniref:PQQ-dependent sugar dehydrogenase n=1 Tax=Dyadobacter sp. CY261 TaxID=2907203 RepID=UPI001F2CCB53|nr:PQQ-dependent sugar dehydrogenase [Dyadobacter sp. CY261]MCF0069073.1 PQQ-dependent sugar dehydrogenase [Dyadobacter sp. CY261]